MEILWSAKLEIEERLLTKQELCWKQCECQGSETLRRPAREVLERKMTGAVIDTKMTGAVSDEDSLVCET